MVFAKGLANTKKYILLMQIIHGRHRNEMTMKQETMKTRILKATIINAMLIVLTKSGSNVRIKIYGPLQTFILL